MGIKMDLIGQKFNRLTVIKEVEKRGKSTSAFWLCRCDCQKEIIATSQELKSGHSKSCGCYKKDIIIQRNQLYATHKHSINGKMSPEYRVWHMIKQRCYNKKHIFYKYYGGRGIKAEDWVNSFEKFLLDMGNRPSLNHSIDRIDNNGNYCKENCRWTTAKEQANNRRNTRFFVYNGESKTISQLAEIAGITYNSMKFRLKSGWSIERAMTTPVKRRFIYKK